MHAALYFKKRRDNKTFSLPLFTDHLQLQYMHKKIVFIDIYTICWHRRSYFKTEIVKYKL